MSSEIKNLMKLLLPEFLVDHFDVVKVNQISSRIDIYLEENITAPIEFKDLNLISHGFHKQSIIKDFPIRGKQVYLYVKRRRWLNKSTKEVVSRDWNILAKGTRMTAEFASFLKGIN
tara:strand:- start:1013 stop:1363 length:351 start_codon:yes stop_codon:yes gene_type:complete